MHFQGINAHFRWRMHSGLERYGIRRVLQWMQARYIFTLGSTVRTVPARDILIHRRHGGAVHALPNE